jgi:hypothetical protein
MCFFVDGLDEYEGDPEEISQYFKDLSLHSDHAKFCVSSRPWPIFQDIYQGVPGLRVQDMTHDDIKLYVGDKLEKNQKMQELLAEDPEDASGLIQDLVDKAAGVFLWVVLVVKSLIKGLRNGDGVVHLRRRLAQIPSDIESLYEHMLESIDPLDVEEASQMFQIFRRSGHDLDLPTLERALRFSDYRIVIDMKITKAQVTDSDLAKEAGLKRIAMRLNSRRKGLLEALKDDPTPTFEIELKSEEALQPGSVVVKNKNQNKRKRRSDPENHYLSPCKFRQHGRVDSDFYDSDKTALKLACTNSSAPHEHSSVSVSPDGRAVESTEETGTVIESLRIFYLHRTVRDYLEHPRVWERLLAKTKSTDLTPAQLYLWPISPS